MRFSPWTARAPPPPPPLSPSTGLLYTQSEKMALDNGTVAPGETVVPTPFPVEMAALLSHAGLFSLTPHSHPGDSSDSWEGEVFVGMLLGVAQRSSVHDAIVVLVERILCEPLTVMWTADFVSFWQGIHSVRRRSVSSETWTGMTKVVEPLLAQGLCVPLQTDDQPEYTLVADPAGSLFDSGCIDNVPWRLVVLRGLLGTLAQIGHAHRHTRVSVLQGVQAASRRVAVRLASEATSRRFFPVECHHESIGRIMETLPTLLVHGWEPTHALRDNVEAGGGVYIART